MNTLLNRALALLKKPSRFLPIPIFVCSFIISPVQATTFTYAQISDPIISASLSANFAAFTAHRYFDGIEVNSIQLSSGGVTLDLSNLFFGTTDVFNGDTALIDQGLLGTGVISRPIDQSFYPMLKNGSVGLYATLTDTYDGWFAIDYFSLSINGNIVDTIGGNNGFGIGLSEGANLPAPLPDALSSSLSQNGFDEAISSISYQPAPSPGTLSLFMAVLIVLIVRRTLNQLAAKSKRGHGVRMVC